MRNWITIVESITPSWFRQGEVADLLHDPRWEDLGDFLNPGEFDYEWRLCMVPVATVSHALLDPAIHGEESENRLRDIKQWIGQGDYAAMLRQQPPLALISQEGFHLLDGNHRTHLAIEMGMTQIPMVVAFGEPTDP